MASAPINQGRFPKGASPGEPGTAGPDPQLVANGQARATTSGIGLGRLQGIEGLRALAASSIVVYHVWLYSAPDQQPLDLGLLNRFVLQHLPVGVTLFFTLSGFLLFRPWAAAALRGRSRPDVRHYWRKRALRIFPAYWVILLITGALLPAAIISEAEGTLGRLAPGVLVRNALLVQNYFPGSMNTGILPTWSLAIELGFYLVLPVLGVLGVMVAAGRATRRSRLLGALFPIAVIVVVGAGLKLVGYTVVPPESVAHPILFLSFGYHADLFALGMGLAVVRVQLEDSVIRLPAWWRPATWLALGVLVAATVRLADRGLVSRWDALASYDRLTALACALLLALVVLPRGGGGGAPWIVRVLETRAMVAVGLGSYSLFLWHEPLIRFMQHSGLTMGGRAGLGVNLVAAAAISGVLSTATYRLVERPALARRSRRRMHVTASSPSAEEGLPKEAPART